MLKILVPCDFSNTAVQAFRFACEIASVSKGEVFLLNVIELPSVHSSLIVPVQAYENAFLKEFKSRANKNFEKLKEKWAGKVRVHLTIEHGSVSSAISKFVDRRRIDVVIMGTHGASGLREYTIGSNTEKIVRNSKVPVMAIKKSVKVGSIKDIIFPTNLSLTQKNLVENVKTLQKFFKAKLHVLNINNPANFARDVATEKRMAEFAKLYQLKNYTLNIYNDIDEESGIVNFSAKFRNKMVAMSTHGRKGIAHLLSGSIAEDVVNHIDGPVCTFAE